jgi:hypothetical protein
MKTSHGGKRIGAGRKPKATELEIIENLDSIINETDVLVKLKELIDKGDLRAIQLYLNYRRGKPKDSIDINSTENVSVDFKTLMSRLKKE